MSTSNDQTESLPVTGMAITGIAAGGLSYGFFLYCKSVDLQGAITYKQNDIQHLKADSAEVAANPQSAKAYDILNKKIDFTQEITQNQKEIKELQDETPVSGLGLMMPVVSLIIGAKAAVTYAMFKDVMKSRRSHKQDALNL